MWKRPKAATEPPLLVTSNSPPPLHQPTADLSVALQSVIQQLDASADDYATKLTARLLEFAVERAASDVHLDATEQGYIVRLRIDGRLHAAGHIPQGSRTNIAARIKAMSQLLTYRCDIPQEGRLTFGQPRREARVVTLPTLHGERIVMRIVAAAQSRWTLQDLGLEAEQLDTLEQALQAPAGVILFTGPVGSGKTTSAYAALRYLAAAENDHSVAPARLGRCVVTLEDPIESELPGVAQSQIDPQVGFDWSAGLKSLLRQDPEVIFIGEIRDAHTAQLAFRASMTGQLVVSTMHARSVCEALLRLIDMQVPSQHLLSGLRLLTCQRLVARRCSCDKGCEQCGHSGLSGRLLLSESLPELSQRLARIVMSDCELGALEQAALEQGWQTLADTAARAVAQDRTTAAEVARL